MKKTRGKRALKNPEIRALIFDLGNVLVHFDARRAARFFVKACGISEAKIWNYFFTSSAEQAYTCGEITCREFYELVRKDLGIRVPFQTFRKVWNSIFWENPGMDALLRKLKAHYPLYLISNTNRMHFDYLCRHFRLLRHFDRMFPSHEVHCRKPELRIYREVLKAVKLRPAETVFIDDIPEFVAGARKAGMQAIRFQTRTQVMRDLKKRGVRF